MQPKGTHALVLTSPRVSWNRLKEKVNAAIDEHARKHDDGSAQAPTPIPHSDHGSTDTQRRKAESEKVSGIALRCNDACLIATVQVDVVGSRAYYA